MFTVVIIIIIINNIIIIISSSSSSSASSIRLVRQEALDKAELLTNAAVMGEARRRAFGRGDDTVGSPHRAQMNMSRLKFFELILSLVSDKQFPVERFLATVSQSTLSASPRATDPQAENLRVSTGVRQNRPSPSLTEGVIT